MSTAGNLGIGGAGILSGISGQMIDGGNGIYPVPNLSDLNFQITHSQGLMGGSATHCDVNYGVYEVEWSTSPNGSYTKTLMYGNPNRFEVAKSIMDEADKKQLKYFHLKSLVLKSLAQAPIGIPVNQEILNG